MRECLLHSRSSMDQEASQPLGQYQSQPPKERTDWRNVWGATAWFSPHAGSPQIRYFLFCIFLFLLLCHAHFFQRSVATTVDSSLYLHERYIVSKLGK